MPLPDRLETPRLVLRRWTEADRDPIAAIWSNPSVWEWLAPGRDLDLDAIGERFERKLRHWDEHGFGLYVLRERGGEEALGWTGPMVPDGVPGVERDVEIVWTLGPAGRGRGLATEAARACAEAAMAGLERDEVISLIEPRNAASRAVAERLGMTVRERTSKPEYGVELDVYSLSRSRDAGRESGR
jgi:RimJ/RimL family protein N-acetyltransferase